MIGFRDLVLLLILTLSCFQFLKTPVFGNDHGLNNGDRAYIATNAIAIKQLVKKYSIHCAGTGVSDKNGINMLSLSFQVTKEMNIKNARKLLINIVHDYLEILNADKQLQPYLAKHPFDEKNIEIRLFFYTQDQDYVLHPNIGVASSIKGSINYKTVEDASYYKIQEVYSETYEEALEKLQASE